MRFTNAWNSVSTSVPTRHCLYTGIYPIRNGGHYNLSAIREGVETMPVRLARLGYRVGLAGKWHIHPKEAFPFERVPGFAVNCLTKDPSHTMEGVEEFISRDREEPFCLVVAGDNEEITSFADLAGRSCANALNSTAGDLARKAGAELSDASLTAAMDLIVSGRADATVNNVAAVEEYMKERPDMNVKIAAIYEPEEGEEWIIQSAVAFQKGADTLTEKVNEILQEMIDDGTCYDLTVQYFGQSVADSTSIYQK